MMTDKQHDPNGPTITTHSPLNPSEKAAGGVPVVQADPETVKRLMSEAVTLAAQWQRSANAQLKSDERKFQDQMADLCRQPLDKVKLTQMIDQSFRSENSVRVSDQLVSLLEGKDEMGFFSDTEKFLMRLYLKYGRHFPGIAVPAIINRIRAFSSRAIIPGEASVLGRHLTKRQQQGVRMNINHLGEAVLGEEEARTRLDEYVRDLNNPKIEYISVKISTIYSQIQSLAFDHSVEVLQERLTELYEAAGSNSFKRLDGTSVPKFVNLDMEEFKDLDITLAAFMNTLDLPKFKDHSAGIVLQAYLPDSYAIQKQLTEWAVKRVDNGGAPIKIRIVKGANMEMEQVDASLHDWPLATYDNKQDVDANYKRMVLYGMTPDNMRAVHLGIASHNLFELAFSYLVAKEQQVLEQVSFEMLEGMAEHVRRAITVDTNGVLLYAPVAEKEQFINAIAYLIRRLDENTAPDNFLRYAAGLKPDSDEWQFLEAGFRASFESMETASITSFRTQNRLTETHTEQTGTFYEGEFVNEPDTDWTVAANREWAKAITTKWKFDVGCEQPIIPVVVAGQEISEDRKIRDCYDPSQSPVEVCTGRYALGTEADVELAVEIAHKDPDGWRDMTYRERHEILSRVANELRQARGDLIGVAAAGTGKLFTESDVEVSEAIDFAEYYPHSANLFADMDHIEVKGKGVGLVVSPWNFPIAIPCGGMIASLAAGNTVIFKPASDAVQVAWELCKAIWKAGVSKNVLQFLPCSGAEVGSKLTAHPDIDFVILTGGTETGLKMLEQTPGLFLAAETGGKNATIVTSMADRDQAIKNIIQSAFGNTGQKCSATSLLILEGEVYEDKNFKRQLVDAARSFATGSAWDFKNRMGPLVNPPSGELKQSLTQLEAGESWALKPENIEENPYLWTPGIKWDVTPGSFTHMTEFFGPLLAVMKADSLEHAIELTNQTGYGLTSGIESLDVREQEIWKEKIEAGNLYINRGTTGAITLRQPFGGMKKSALGPGIKAGSPNYVSQFMQYTEKGFPPHGPIFGETDILRRSLEWKQKVEDKRYGQLGEEVYRSARAVASYLYHYEREFSQDNDYFHLRGQDNILRYTSLGSVIVRVHPEDNTFDILARVAGALICGNTVTLSVPEGLENSKFDFLMQNRREFLPESVKIETQSDEELAQNLEKVDRIRYAAPDRVPELLLKKAAVTGFYIASAPVLMEGRIELLHYVRNQSICDSFHRYGNLGERALV